MPVLRSTYIFFTRYKSYFKYFLTLKKSSIFISICLIIKELKFLRFWTIVSRWILSYPSWFILTKLVCGLHSGAYSGICPEGGLNFFSGGSAPVGAWKPPEIKRFHWFRGAWPPWPPPEYAPAYISDLTWTKR